MKKTLLIVTDNSHNQINGVVTTYKNIEKHALHNGYIVKYILPDMFFHIDSPGYPEVKLSIPWQIDKKIKEINPDYIHIATEGPLGLAVLFWCNKHNINFSSAYHTKFPEFLKKLYNIPEGLTYSYVRWFHKHSGKVLTTTKTMVNDLKSHGFNGDIIPWTRGVDRSIFKRNYDKTLNKNEIILLSVGRISKEKNLDVFCQLKLPNYQNVKKIVVGDGPYLDELKKRYPDVCFVGAKTGHELANYFSQADVFVFTSKTDTFGIVLLDALASGVPVAAYPVTGPLDVITSDKVGNLNEDLKVAMTEALKLDPQDCRNFALNYTWAHCTEQFFNNLVPAIEDIKQPESSLVTETL